MTLFGPIGADVRHIVERMFDCPEVLVAAKHLVGFPGIEVAHEIKEVTYFHMLFERHEIVWSNGAESESMYLGKEALKSVSKEARDEISELFPTAFQPETDNEPTQAMTFSNGQKGRQISFRHLKNEKALVNPRTH